MRGARAYLVARYVPSMGRGSDESSELEANSRLLLEQQEARTIDWLATGEARVIVARERYEAFRFAVEATRDFFDRCELPSFEPVEALILRRIVDGHNPLQPEDGVMPNGVAEAARKKASEQLDELRRSIANLFNLDYDYYASFEKQPKDDFPKLASGPIGKALNACQRRIAYYERALSAEQIAVSELNLQHGSAAYNSWVKLQETIGGRRYDAVRDLLVFAGLIPDKSDELKRLLKTYYSRSFDRPMGIMHYLDHRGRHPSGHSVEEEQHFRDDLLDRIKAI